PGPPRTPRAESRAEPLPYCAGGGMRASRSASSDELLLLLERLIREDERTVRERVHTVGTALERVADVDVIDAIALGEEEHRVGPVRGVAAHVGEGQGWRDRLRRLHRLRGNRGRGRRGRRRDVPEIGRASCRESGQRRGGGR